MQQHLMQMQPLMAGGHNLTTITTDHIQQYLDENKSLILKILESQKSGTLSECAENQARLQRNLMYLAAIADCQPQPPSLQAQFSPNMAMQPGVNYLQQQQQSQQMMPDSPMAARAPMFYAQPQQHPYLAMQQQQQQQQAALQSQLGMSSTGMGGINMLQSEPNVGGNGTGARALSDIGRGMTGEGLSAVSVSRGLGSASKQDADKGEAV